MRAAKLLDPRAERRGDDADLLPAVLTALMRDVGLPAGIGAIGYDESDVDDLVEGSLAQQRLLATSPREVGAHDLAGILRRSVQLW